MRWLAKIIFYYILGWRVIGKFNPEIKKAVVIVLPHTSWHDFYIGALVRKIIGVQINFVGKKELFDSAFGWYFKWMGGAPIDRTKSKNTVDQVVSIFESKNEFRLAIAPEGTRKKVKEWKTGFYYIAQKANVPIIPVAFNYKTKEVVINEAFYISDNLENDLKKLKEKFVGVVGKIPEYT
jgi:1-acyl-sn-glycerol-3-phosphate acyltransferase